MQNARLDEAQAGIKIARRNINNLRYVDATAAAAKLLQSCSTLPSERYCSFKWVGKDVKPAADEKLQVPTMLR